MSHATVRVALVDDEPLMRVAFRTIFDANGIAVVGEAGSGDEAIELARAARPDVMLMDVRMPGRDGVDATRVITAEVPDVRVLVLTTFTDDDALFGALVAGAAGFLLKNSAPEDIVRAVHQVATGDAVLDPSVAGRVFARFAGREVAPARVGRLADLTEREKDVLALVAQGMTNAEIAQRLSIGEATSKTHVSRVLMKLGVRDRVQAVIYAFETGFAPADRAL